MSLTPAVSDNDHIQADSKAIIELIEYGDFQCPHCGRAYPMIKQIQQKFGKELRFIFRNFPLSNSHPQAKIAAIAAEAANKQGKFWEMHDILFENQTKLISSALVEYAKIIGLNVEQFILDLKNDELEKEVDADFESGLRSGVNFLPAFFINGEIYDGEIDEESLEAYIKSKVDYPVY